ncbi:hypothetical protein ACTWM0_13305 [Pseudomonas machongensis]
MSIPTGLAHQAVFNAASPSIKAFRTAPKTNRPAGSIELSDEEHTEPLRRSRQRKSPGARPFEPKSS